MHMTKGLSSIIFLSILSIWSNFQVFGQDTAEGIPAAERGYLLREKESDQRPDCEIPVIEDVRSGFLSVEKDRFFGKRKVLKWFRSSPREDFDELFKIGLLLFSLGLLFIVMAIFAVSGGMLILCVTLGSLLLISSWMISFNLISKGKEVPSEHRDSSFILKKVLAFVVAIGGSLLALSVFALLGLLLFL